MPSFRFLHCADLHIDSPLRGLEADPDAPAARIRSATRDAFEALIQYAVTQKVAFILAAGDLYDGDWQDWRTGQFMIRQLGLLARADPPIPFIAIRGNHDAASVISRRLSMPEPACLLGATRPETFHKLRELGVVIHGQSFATRAVEENLALSYPAAEPGMLNIGLLHTSLDGRNPNHQRYAPCAVDDLRNKGYQYWALGHIHLREVVSDDPTAWIVFPGNLQGRHAKETGAKGATLVTVEDGRITKVEPLNFDLVRWTQLHVDLGSVEDEDAALARTRACLTDALAEAGGRLLAARILLSGATEAHASLNRDPAALREKIRSEAMALADLDALWVESVAVAATPPAGQAAVPGHLAAAFGKLTLADMAPVAAKYCGDLLGRFGGLRDELAESAHPIATITNDALPTELLERARNLLLARLRQD